MRIKVYEDQKQPTHKWRWTAWSSSDIVADSGQGYVDRAGALKAAESVKAGMGSATIEVVPTPLEKALKPLLKPRPKRYLRKPPPG